ncbi:MAG TPA: TetR family transcriptional regulator [Alphaproteobacteria bacterium]|nr:TetR family transcriptional regulator [Alphaproteobacteria bacterium]
MPPAKKSQKAPVPDRIIDGMLAVVAEKGWMRASMHEIADRADVSIAQLYDHHRTKISILSACMRRVDHAVLAGVGKGAESESARDRLFDVMMKRFDALTPHKEAVGRILRDIPFDPPAALWLACRAKNSMRWMLEAAGVSGSGILGRIRIKGLLAIYVATLRVWLGDDSEDMGKTMAFLDKRLTRAETVVNRACGFARPGRRSSEPAEEAV